MMASNFGQPSGQRIQSVAFETVQKMDDSAK